MKRIVLFLVIALFFVACEREAPKVNITPKPNRLWVSNDAPFYITKHTQLLVESGNEEVYRLGTYLSGMIKEISGMDLPVIYIDEIKAVGKDIIMTTDVENEDLGKEGYKMRLDANVYSIIANEEEGLFRGIQSFIQLLPAELYKSDETVEEIELARAYVTDIPAYEYRGMHLDVGRHFFPVEFIKKYIDLIALYKMNTFHWHLTEDQGWRIEIMQYPKLTEVGAWRTDGEGNKYGGFYTQEDIKEIVAYAQERYITVIPEIELPGHCMASLAAYPELSCTGKQIEVPTVWGVKKDVYCAGNEEVFTFLENVLTEVIELFPGEYIHIGGDEVPKDRWKKCKKCQSRIRKEGLKDEYELQSYFIKRIETFLGENDRRLIGWDEILEGGLAPDATVMSWRGMEGGIDAAQQGHDVIMSPTSHCYFDYYQADPEFQPKAIGGFTTLKKVYSFNPTPEELNDAEAEHILGGQGNVWTEYMKTTDYVEYMAVPRMIALAEVLWTNKDRQGWDDFLSRMNYQYTLLDYLDVNYCPGSYKVDLEFTTDSMGKSFVELDMEIFNGEIRYTTDGSDPGTESPVYSEPIQIDKTTTFKAGVFVNGELKENLTEKKISVHKGFGKTVDYKEAYSNKYEAGGDLAMVNGIKGSLYHNDGNWQGFHGNDMDLIIDLGKEMNVSGVSVEFIQDVNRWIFLPEEVEVGYSTDGKTFTSGKSVTEKELYNKPEALINNYLSGWDSPVKARYISVKAANMGTCPKGHPGEGQKAWIFADEIVID